MKFAVRFFCGLASLALMFSIMSCGMGRQLHWREAELAGVYSLGASCLSAIAAGILFGIDWARKNIRIQ
jgi:hypothetical protein